MKRWIPILALVALSGCAGGKTLSTSTQLSSHPLIGSLMRSFGLTADQAVGVSGTLLGLGHSRMDARHWTQLASAVPDVTGIITAGNALAGVTATPQSLADLQGPFAKLGLSQQQISTLIPGVTGYVGRVAGPEVAGAFASAMR